jgi:hypothetical protein
MKRNRDLILIVLLLGLVLLSGCGKRKEPAFAIFLLSSDMTSEEMLATPLQDLPVQDGALLTLDDVVSYQPDKYEMVLTDEAAERIRQLAIPLDGLPFVVVAQGERVYAGSFWTPVSSLSYSGTAVMFWMAEDKVVLRFDLSYPASPDMFEGVDLRNDARILEAFAKVEKLIQ